MVAAAHPLRRPLAAAALLVEGRTVLQDPNALVQAGVLEVHVRGSKLDPEMVDALPASLAADPPLREDAVAAVAG